MPSRPVRDSNVASLSDEALVHAAVAGDEQAWEELIVRYSPLIYSIPVRYGMDQSASDDVFQEVIAALLNQLGSIRDVQSLPKWLITTTHRVTWRAMRGTGRELTLEGHTVSRDEPPEHLALRWERQHLMHQALNELGGRCADLLIALHRGPSPPDYSQISRELNMPVGSIGPTRSRCLRKLLKILREMDFTPD